MTYNARVAVMHQITKIIDFGKGVESKNVNGETTIGEMADRIIAMVEKGREAAETVEPYSKEDIRVTAGMHEAITERPKVITAGELYPTKAKDLIAELQKFDPETEIWLHSSSYKESR